jgi:polyhydroxyalkanoate synthase
VGVQEPISRRGQTGPKPSRKRKKRRDGPRPLLLHLMMGSGLWTSSYAALALSRIGSPPWKPELLAEGEALARALVPENPDRGSDAGAIALDEEVRARLDAFLTGIERYRAHPYRRRLSDPAVLWAEGSTRLFDFRRPTVRLSRAPAVLLVPSLINRSTILDLSARRSLARFLAKQGLSCFLLDWGCPGDAERDFGLTDYICQRLVPAIGAVRQACGRGVVPVGYCMGGMLALAGALRAGNDVAGLGILATPWDFHAGAPLQARVMQAGGPLLRWYIDTQNGLPVDALQTMFAWVDPLAVARKFRAFARLSPESLQARDFVAVEDWLNDGVPLAPAVAKEAICDWIGQNAPARGAWRIDGEPVLPARFEQPAIAFLPMRDKLVPPPSALALVRSLPQATLVEVGSGHIGMLAGSNAPAGVYRPLARWIESLA